MRDRMTAGQEQSRSLSQDRLRVSRLQAQFVPEEFLLVGEQGGGVPAHVESRADADGAAEKPVQEGHWLDERHEGERLDVVVDHVGRAEHVEVHRKGTEVDDGTVEDVGEDGVALHHRDHRVHLGSLSYEVLNPFRLDEVERHVFGCVLVVIVSPPPHAGRVAKDEYLWVFHFFRT